MTLSRRSFVAAGAAGIASLALRRRILRACIFGHTGRGGYGHGLDTCFNFSENIRRLAVADPDLTGRVAAMKRLGLAQGYASLEEMLDREEADLVSIGPRWVERKLEYITLAAKKRASVYLEKPIAASLEEADASIVVAEKAGIKIVVAHQVRLCPQVVHLKKAIEEGLLGQLLEIRTRGKEDQRAGGEDLMVLGTHCLYLMRYFAGDPLWCTARITQEGREITATDKRAASEPLGPVAGDTIDAAFAFSQGVMGHFASHKVPKGQGGRFQFTLYGSRGVAQFAIGQDPKVSYLSDPLWTQGRAGEWKPLPGAPSNDDPSGAQGTDACNKRIVDELIRIRESGNRSPVDIIEGRATLEMIMAVYAAHLGGARATFPLKDRKHPLGAL
jgi:predicted dehydrogenase